VSIALLCPSMRPERDADEPELLEDLAAGLSARGHRVRVITSHAGPPSTTVVDGVQVRRNWRAPAGRLERRGFESGMTHLAASYASLMRGRADLAHASHAPDAVVAALWSRRRGRPAVFSCMETPDREWLVARRLRVDCMLRAVRGCAVVVTASRFAADALLSSLGVSARVIHPGVDVSRFTIADHRSASPTILCPLLPDAPAGGVGLLLGALEQVRRERADVTMLFPRPRDPALAGAIARRPGTEFLETARPGPSAHQSAWASVLPSPRAAFEPAIAESLACGTPVVARGLGASAELIDRPEIGAIFDGEDPALLAGALLGALELAEDPATTPACRRRAEELSIDRCVDAYEALYAELLAKA
jgi:glycosyltransferase involved in cell wall biosynthesis